MSPCPSVRPQLLETRDRGKPEPEGREKEDKVIHPLWLRPRFRCMPDEKWSPPAPRRGGRPQPGISRHRVSSCTSSLDPDGSLHLPLLSQGAVGTLRGGLA